MISSTAEIHEHIHNPNNHLRGSRASDSMATHASQERAVFLADGVHQPGCGSCFVARCEYREFEPPREPSLYGTYHGVRSDHLLDGCGIEARQTSGLAALGGHMAITRDLHAADHCRNRSPRLGLAGLGLASAILLGAALAPTDPVLASDIQVGPPNTEEEDEVRFALTSEAGLNDGLSFPFVNLAIAIAVYQATEESWFQNWLFISVVWKLGVALVIGWLMGKALGYLTFHLPRSARMAGTGDELVAIGITCLCYGLTEIADGYGFLAVFIAAVTLRSAERSHHFHEQLHAFTEQIERLLMMLLLVCFGAAMAGGAIFNALSWETVAVGFIILLVVRPLAGIIELAGARPRLGEKWVIAFFGIRGLGSFYYVAYALGATTFQQTEIVWTVVCFVVVISIVMHGIIVKATMRVLDRQTEALAMMSR